MKKTNLVACLTLIIAGIAICFVGLFAPPLGVISPSVIEATGIFLVIAGGFAGLVVDLDLKRLRFFVGLPEQYKQSITEEHGHQSHAPETGPSELQDSTDTP